MDWKEKKAVENANIALKEGFEIKKISANAEIFLFRFIT